MDGKRARKLVLGGRSAWNVRSDRPVEPVAEIKDKGRGAVDHPLRNQSAAAAEPVIAIVAGAGLAADRKQISSPCAVDAADRFGGSPGHDRGQSTLHGRRNL